MENIPGRVSRTVMKALFATRGPVFSCLLKVYGDCNLHFRVKSRQVLVLGISLRRDPPPSFVHFLFLPSFFSSSQLATTLAW